MHLGLVLMTPMQLGEAGVKSEKKEVSQHGYCEDVKLMNLFFLGLPCL
jgi:hypothetical protein